MTARELHATEPDRSYEIVLRRRPSERERHAWIALLPADLLRWRLRKRREARELASFGASVDRVLDRIVDDDATRADLHDHLLDRWRRALAGAEPRWDGRDCIDPLVIAEHERAIDALFETWLARPPDPATRQRFLARLCLGLDDPASLADELRRSDEGLRLAPLVARIDRVLDQLEVTGDERVELRARVIAHERTGSLRGASQDDERAQAAAPGCGTGADFDVLAPIVHDTARLSGEPPLVAAERLAGAKRLVDELFAQILARRPDEATSRSFVAWLCVRLDDRASLSERLRASDEHRQIVAPLRARIDDAYRRFMHRAPAADEVRDAFDRVRTTLRTREELVGAIADGTVRRHLGIRPLKLEIDVTTQCNLRCTMCYLSDPRFGKREREDIGVEAFARIARDVFPHCGLVSLSFGTEPLLHPQLPELLEIVAAEGVPWRYLITNAQLLDETLIEAFVRVPLHGFSVSIDAATPATYERIRRGGRWERLIANLEALQAAKRRAGAEYPRITFNFVMMRSNVDELPALVRLAAKLGVEGVAAMHLTPFEGLDLEHEQLDREPERCNAILRETRAEAERLGVPISLPEAFERDAGPVRTLKQAAPAGFLFPPVETARSGCPFPRQFVGIDPYGSVVPCGHWYTEQPIGNVHSRSVGELWDGEAWSALRREHATGELRATCRSCPAAGMGNCDDPGAFGSVRLGNEVLRGARRKAEEAR